MGHCYQGMTFVSIMLLLFVSELFLLVAYVRLSESVEFLFSYSYHSQFNQKSISCALSLSLPSSDECFNFLLMHYSSITMIDIVLQPYLTTPPLLLMV
jgi:hypothetical protein